MNPPWFAASAFSFIRKLAWSSIDVRIGVGASRRVVTGASASVEAAAIAPAPTTADVAVGSTAVEVSSGSATAPAVPDLRFSFAVR